MKMFVLTGYVHVLTTAPSVWVDAQKDYICLRNEIALVDEGKSERPLRAPKTGRLLRPVGGISQDGTPAAASADPD